MCWWLQSSGDLTLINGKCGWLWAHTTLSLRNGVSGPGPKVIQYFVVRETKPYKRTEKAGPELGCMKCSSFLCSHSTHMENTLRIWVLSVDHIAFWGLHGWRIASGDLWSPGNFFLFPFNSSCRSPLSLKDDFDANVNACFCFSFHLC